MHRRNFLRNALAGACVYGSSGLPGLITAASAQNGFAPVSRRTLINVMLKGGPDWRHVMPPAWNETAGSVGNAFWKARARSYAASENNASLNAQWSERFFKRESGGQEFGILKTCEWLREMYDDGNVAVVCNVIGSDSRDHLLSELIMAQGNRSSGPNDFERSGWGGRLASIANANVVSLSSAPSAFCYGLHPSGDINQYYVGNHVGIRDTRNTGLHSARPNHDPIHDIQGNITVALETFYANLANEISPDSTYAQFVDHEQVVRHFGELVTDRLASIPEPAALEALYNGALNDKYFGKQVRNLYDALACNDVLDLRVASLEFGGWDTHDGQDNAIEKQLSDLFGAGKAMDSLWRAMPEDARDNAVFVFAGEFGRQLVANGAGGTDHGRGTSYLIVGRGVNGGVRGDMFPEEEIFRHNDLGPDINGQTHLDHVLGSVCDWVEPGSSTRVFPDRSSAMLENGVNPDDLFG